ncbi:hypothetical protein V8C42DRAFT_305537 [Trichoderma barbatum]
MASAHVSRAMQCVLVLQGRVSRHAAPHARTSTRYSTRHVAKNRARWHISASLHPAARLAGGYSDRRGNKDWAFCVRAMRWWHYKQRITRSRAADLSGLAMVGDKGLAGVLAALVCTPQNDSASLLCRSSTARQCISGDGQRVIGWHVYEGVPGLWGRMGRPTRVEVVA